MAWYYGFTLDINMSVHQSICHTSVCLSFPYDNLTKFQGILTKLGTCIDIKEILFGLVMSKFREFLTVICPRHNNDGVLFFYVLFLVEKSAFPGAITSLQPDEVFSVCQYILQLQGLYPSAYYLYAEGYIVFVSSFICLFICTFVHCSLYHVRGH